MTYIDSVIREKPNRATELRYINAARSRWHSDGEIEIDDDSTVSRGCSNGAYVQAWVWVYDDQLDPEPGPSYDVWIAEPDEWEWVFDQTFTCDDDPDGKGARHFAHDYARHLRATYPCAFVAVRRADQGLPLPVQYRDDQ